MVAQSRSRIIGDVVCENLTYGGTDIVGAGQTPRVMRGV